MAGSSQLLAKLYRFILSEDGPSTTEYAVMLALVIGLAIGGLQIFGNGANSLWGDNANQIGSSMPSGS